MVQPSLFDYAPSAEPGSLFEAGSPLGILLAPEPVRAPAAPSKPDPREKRPGNGERVLRRYYAKCAGCLQPVAFDAMGTAMWPSDWDSQDAPLCEACGGRMSLMGVVGRGGVWTRYEEQCACDERCQNATGPKCTCRCGGANHGKECYVSVAVEQGRIRSMGQQDPEKSRRIADEYRAACEAARARLEAMPGYKASCNGEWIADRETWLALDLAKRLYREAKQAKSQKGRLAKLAKVGA